MGGVSVGAKSTKEKFWQEHIAEWKASGLSQRVYCQRNLLAVATFGYWRRKLKLQIGKSDKPRFYPLAVAGGPHQAACLQKGGNSLRLLLDENRFTLEINDEFSPSTLQRLILALEQI
jgi:hypothetical protein